MAPGAALLYTNSSDNLVHGSNFQIRVEKATQIAFKTQGYVDVGPPVTFLI